MTVRKKNDARAGARWLCMTAVVALGRTVAGSAVSGLDGELWVDGRSRALYTLSDLRARSRFELVYTLSDLHPKRSG